MLRVVLKDFEETLQLVREYQFPSLFINQFFPRPGTPAAKMQRVHPQEVRIPRHECVGRSVRIPQYEYQHFAALYNA